MLNPPSSLSFFTRSALHCCASCRASASASALSPASRSHCQQRHQYIPHDDCKKSAPREPRHAPARRRASSRAPSTRAACSASCCRCALKCSSALRNMLSTYLWSSSARSRSYGTALAGFVASDPNIFCAMLRSRFASVRFPAGARRAVRRTVVGSSRCYTRPLCVHGLEIQCLDCGGKKEIVRQMSATFPRER